jgi:hypothetical protein
MPLQPNRSTPPTSRGGAHGHPPGTTMCKAAVPHTAAATSLQRCPSTRCARRRSGAHGSSSGPACWRCWLQPCAEKHTGGGEGRPTALQCGMAQFQAGEEAMQGTRGQSSRVDNCSTSPRPLHCCEPIGLLNVAPTPAKPLLCPTMGLLQPTLAASTEAHTEAHESAGLRNLPVPPTPSRQC